MAVRVSAQQSFSAVRQDANSRVWTRTNVQTTASGKVVTNVHQYTELAAGMYYTNSAGEWLESKEQIDILPQGGASATQGRHQVYFPADIYNGMLEVVTPDGKHLFSRPLGVSYDDGSNSVWLGTLKHSVGLLVSSNKIMYPDAFTDFKADIICTYRRGGFESDLIFREKPPTPDAYGLAPETSTLQLFTEFFNTADPAQNPSVEDKGFGLQDHTLKFGKLTMGRGKAFELGTNTPNGHAKLATPVYKTWANISGRKFLVEQVPLNYVAQDMDALPPVTLSANIRSSAKFASAKRVMPPARGVLAATNQIQLAQLKTDPGLVLDYNELDSDQTDYTFAANTTYYMSSGAVFTGNVTFEGGAVIKFPANNSSFLYVSGGSITCNTTPGSPAIFTSKDDDSVGETISGSSGSPTIGDYACLGAENMSFDAHDLRMRYASWGMYLLSSSAAISDIQVLHSQMGVQYFSCTDCSVRNVLMSDIKEYAFEDYASSVDVEHLTLDQCPQLGFNDGSASLQLTNCLFTGVTLTPPGGGFNIPYVSNSIVILSTNTGVFQSAAAANYYLSTSSTYRNAGSTHINPGLATEFASMTTYAPQDGGYADTDTPDIGYHYPIGEDSDYDGLPDNWEYYWFGTYGNTGSEADSQGNTLLYDYQNNLDPNIINFTAQLGNRHFNTTNATGSFLVQAGSPAYEAVLVNSTNFTGVSWTAYDSTAQMNLGSTDGVYQVWLGLKGPASTATPTWIGTTVYLDRTPPVMTVTNPAPGTVMQPYIQVQGFANERIQNMSYDVSNALGVVTGQLASVTGEFMNTNLLAFTTNYFQCYDVLVTNGVNLVTVHATDWAGNTSSTNVSYTLNYSGKTNAPTMALTWPADGMHIAQNSITVYGTLSDPTATISLQAVDASGNTNIVAAAVERDGHFWVQNVPLGSGTNQLTLNVQDVVNNTNSMDLTVIQDTSLGFTINPVTTSLWKSTTTVSGTIGDDSYTVTVNGVTAENDGFGNWTAENVPNSVGNMATFQAEASTSGGELSLFRAHTMSLVTDPPTEAQLTMVKPAELTMASATWTDDYVAGVPTDYIDTLTTWNYATGKGGTWRRTISHFASGGNSSAEWNAQINPDGSVPYAVYSDGSTITTNYDFGEVYDGPSWGETDDEADLGSLTVTASSTSKETTTGDATWLLHAGSLGVPGNTPNLMVLTGFAGDQVQGVGLNQGMIVDGDDLLGAEIINTGKQEDTNYKSYLLMADGATKTSMMENGRPLTYVANALARYKLVHQTLCVAPADPDNARLDIGIGEVVAFTGMPAETIWTYHGRGFIFTNEDTQTIGMRAASSPEFESVAASIGGTYQSVNFDVVAPESVTVLSLTNQPTGHEDANGTFMGANATYHLIINPLTVSFEGAFIREDTNNNLITVSWPIGTNATYLSDRTDIPFLIKCEDGNKFDDKVTSFGFGWLPIDLLSTNGSYHDCTITYSWGYQYENQDNNFITFQPITKVTTYRGSDRKCQINFLNTDCNPQGPYDQH